MHRATPCHPRRQSTAARPDRRALLTHCTKNTCGSSTPYPCFPSALPADCCYMFILFAVQGLPGSFRVLWPWSVGHELTHLLLHPSLARTPFTFPLLRKMRLFLITFFVLPFKDNMAQLPIPLFYSKKLWAEQKPDLIPVFFHSPGSSPL